ncbi:ABC transporter permease [Actinophytocola sp.]|uniref:ABC transporter permease n=1 Tax=Actinophytocola sp. TaxID=1872138 RepID=UPI002D801049|nr:ABC transporter permease [Actinophytocola sp.]HET9138610.1 ABC transporter permease [Actinophytocola sp.]
MLRFTAQRLTHAVMVILVVTLVTHIGLFYFGDPFKTTPDEKMLPPETQQMLRERFGTDKPFLARYLIYLKNLFTGEFGVDFEQRRPVGELIAHVAPHTAGLAVLAILISLTVGVLAGALAAVRPGTALDAVITTTTITLLCLPVFVVALVFRQELSGLRLFGVELFPALPHAFGVDVPWLREVLLPAITLALVDIAFVARMMRASMLDVLAADYLRTARAKGLSERRVVLRHGMRNAIIPVVNHAGLAIGALMGGAVIVETIFQYDGVGFLFIKSLHDANRPVVIAIALLGAIAFVLLIALVDLISAYLDPRIRVT